MKNNWPIKKLGEVAVGVVFVIFGAAFFIKGQYWHSLISIGLLIILLKIDKLTKLILSPNSGLETEFKIPEEKITEDIKENKETVNQENIKFYKNLENIIIKRVHEELGGELKTGITFVYGVPEKPEFQYIPDGVIRKEDEIILIEIKHIIDPKLAKHIIGKALQNLQHVITKLKPSAGGKLKARLIIASRIDLDTSGISLPENIEIQVIKI